MKQKEADSYYKSFKVDFKAGAEVPESQLAEEFRVEKAVSSNPNPEAAEVSKVSKQKSKAEKKRKPKKKDEGKAEKDIKEPQEEVKQQENNQSTSKPSQPESKKRIFWYHP